MSAIGKFTMILWSVFFIVAAVGGAAASLTHKAPAFFVGESAFGFCGLFVLWAAAILFRSRK